MGTEHGGDPVLSTPASFLSASWTSLCVHSAGLMKVVGDQSTFVVHVMLRIKFGASGWGAQPMTYSVTRWPRWGPSKGHMTFEDGARRRDFPRIPQMPFGSGLRNGLSIVFLSPGVFIDAVARDNRPALLRGPGREKSGHRALPLPSCCGRVPPCLARWVSYPAAMAVCERDPPPCCARGHCRLRKLWLSLGDLLQTSD